MARNLGSHWTTVVANTKVTRSTKTLSQQEMDLADAFLSFWTLILASSSVIWRPISAISLFFSSFVNGLFDEVFAPVVAGLVDDDVVGLAPVEAVVLGLAPVDDDVAGFAYEVVLP